MWCTSLEKHTQTIWPSRPGPFRTQRKKPHHFFGTCLAAAVRRASKHTSVWSCYFFAWMVHWNRTTWQIWGFNVCIYIYIYGYIYMVIYILYICINRQGLSPCCFIFITTLTHSYHWSPPGMPHPELVWIACHPHWAWYHNVGVLSATNEWSVVHTRGKTNTHYSHHVRFADNIGILCLKRNALYIFVQSF